MKSDNMKNKTKIDEEELLDDLRSIAEAKKAHKAGKTISYAEVARRLGIKISKKNVYE